MFNVVFGKGRHGERRGQGLVWSWTLGLLALGPVLQYISCISITEGAVSNEKNKVQKIRLPLSQINYIKCSHKLFSCRFNVYPLYPGTNFFFLEKHVLFMLQKVFRFHSN